MTETIRRPSWVPLAGHQLHLAGVHFDAVRVDGIRGELVADWLVEATDDDAGPIVCEAGGGRWAYFLLAPGAAAGRAAPSTPKSVNKTAPTVIAPLIRAPK
ncbi:hypothetical protein ACFUTR_22285 [Streptomyces sp. NPDC057367]|uniref:hypothetical protein n=1 Tax=Streptomyces sp. NPDC057367 TaxID=3346108 RepID=UPI00362D5D11